MLKTARTGSRLGLSIALLVIYPMSSAEAGMNKCTDGKQITYTTEPCEKTGLAPAGPIKEAVTVMTFVPKTQNDTSGKTGTEQTDADKAPQNVDPDADVQRETTIKPVNPLVNKMLKW